METEIVLQSQKTITHKWYNLDDIRQDYVNYAYKLWWIDFVKMIECENWTRDITRRWDGGKAIWLCQIHTSFHSLPSLYYTSRQTQVELCYNKRKQGTKFYWPSRIIKWVKCSQYVENRFIY